MPRKEVKKMQNYSLVTIILIFYELPIGHTSAIDLMFKDINFLPGITLLTTIVMTLGLIIDKSSKKTVYLAA